MTTTVKMVMKLSAPTMAMATRRPTARIPANRTPKPSPAMARMVSRRLSVAAESAMTGGSRPTLRTSASSKNPVINQGM